MAFQKTGVEDRSRVLQAEHYPVNDNYQRWNEIYQAEEAVEVNQPTRSYEYMVPTDNPSLQRMTIPTPWEECGPAGHPHIQVAHTTTTDTNIPQVTQPARRVGSPSRSGNRLPTEDRRFPIVRPQQFSRIGGSQAPILRPTQHAPTSRVRETLPVLYQEETRNFQQPLRYPAGFRVPTRQPTATNAGLREFLQYQPAQPVHYQEESRNFQQPLQYPASFRVTTRQPTASNAGGRDFSPYQQATVPNIGLREFPQYQQVSRQTIATPGSERIAGNVDGARYEGVRCPEQRQDHPRQRMLALSEEHQRRSALALAAT